MTEVDLTEFCLPYKSLLMRRVVWLFCKPEEVLPIFFWRTFTVLCMRCSLEAERKLFSQPCGLAVTCQNWNPKQGVPSKRLLFQRCDGQKQLTCIYCRSCSPKYFEDNYRQHNRRVFWDISYVWESYWEMNLDIKILKYKEHFSGPWEKLETHLILRLS